jgi:LysR family transcriptional regulator (chromosome initiation inhibitor)
MLRITQSALSQRISALERETGMVLVQRSRPVCPTRPGSIILGLAHRVALLNADAEHLLKAEDLVVGDSGMVRVSLAINADSISTWFQPVIAQLASERAILLDLHVEDQDHTETLLREGAVMAAVTTSSNPAPGCTVEPLGTMVYWPACAPSLLSRREAETFDLSTLPMLRFDVKDDLQHAYLRQINVEKEPPVHYIPSNREFLMAARLGLGWGVLPEGQITRDLASGRLVKLHPYQAVEVPLYWQRWRFDSPTLGDLTDIVRRAAFDKLSPTSRDSER